MQLVESTESKGLTVVQQVMREMGAKGGKIGGKRRLETMTEEQRSEALARQPKRDGPRPRNAINLPVSALFS